jgi:hypothetical protein
MRLKEAEKTGVDGRRTAHPIMHADGPVWRKESIHSAVVVFILSNSIPSNARLWVSIKRHVNQTIHHFHTTQTYHANSQTAPVIQ